MRDRKLKIFGMMIVAAVVVTTLVMLLWNALLPAIFGVKSIGFFQALGLLILCKILFGGFGGHGMFARHGREMRERWMAMTPEQREAFINQRGSGRGRGHGCCSWGRGGRSDRHECHDHHDHAGRDDRADRSDRHEFNERQAHSDSHDANDRPDRPDPRARHDLDERTDRNDPSERNNGEKPIDNGGQR